MFCGFENRTAPASVWKGWQGWNWREATYICKSISQRLGLSVRGSSTSQVKARPKPQARETKSSRQPPPLYRILLCVQKLNPSAAGASARTLWHVFFWLLQHNGGPGRSKRQTNSAREEICRCALRARASWKKEILIGYWLDTLLLLKQKLPSRFLWRRIPWPPLATEANVNWCFFSQWPWGPWNPRGPGVGRECVSGVGGGCVCWRGGAGKCLKSWVPRHRCYGDAGGHPLPNAGMSWNRSP